jgi:mono/diheme cytochrome c family protein
MSKTILIVSLVLLSSLFACAGGKSENAGAKTARSFYNSKCATCHGPQGLGDGLLAGSLNPKPRDYSDAAWQGSVTDEYLKKVITEGGRAGGLSPLMPSSPELKNDPVMLGEVVSLIRSFAQ